ncbi:MAG: hypothetical protein KDD00_15490, partial [Ignavibacteriae bacterium]|nr:hypothetical protein [Ignavibacteriota bacterium]
RYDVRGRVIKMWNIISGFDTLITDYSYNSQDQVTDYSHTGLTEIKTYRNTYDYAGRLEKVEYYTGPPDAPDPDYINITEYDYNPNSQVSSQQFNDNTIENVYSYNNRNWIASMINSQTIFDFTNSYFRNGNVKTTELSGDYNKNFASSSALTFDYSYDKSNRLIETSNSSKYFDLINTYDKDGNILTLDRNGSTGNQIDDFNYAYYSGTNKLQRVYGSGTQYTYDANGNMTSDALNRNTNITYDHRNLILELRHTKYILNDSLIILTKYYYDEAGNRIRKMSYNTSNDSLINDVIYSRDISGRELAIYENGSIEQWNIYGMDNTGFIDGNDNIRYYMKDHLGSVRAVTDGTGGVVSSQDYDAWGYLLENRVYESDASIYKFTSKERDDENQYDYFGARYYDARVGRWGQMEPLLDKYLQITPYNYSLNNPLRIVDPNGNDPRRDQLASIEQVVQVLEDNVGKTYWELGSVFSNSNVRYIYTEKQGFIDLQHFFSAAEISSKYGVDIALKLGEGVESAQSIEGNESAWDPEDLPSNKVGAIFGSEIWGNRNNLNIEMFQKFIMDQNPFDPADPMISEDKLYIPRNEIEQKYYPLPQKTNYKPYYGESPNYIENYIKYGPPVRFPEP